jgi:hypothetical protein
MSDTDSNEDAKVCEPGDSDFSCVTRPKDQGYRDCLDGIPLRHNEPVIVLWPDGSETHEVVSLLPVPWPASEFDTAFLLLAHKGTAFRLRLLDGNVRLRRLNEEPTNGP